MNRFLWRSRSSQPEARSQPWRRYFLLSLMGPPLLLSAAWVLPGAWDMAASGACPAAPDATPHPCSVGDYLWRMTLGLPALLGHGFMWITWWVLNLGLWGLGLVLVAIYRQHRAAGSTRSNGVNGE